MTTMNRRQFLASRGGGPAALAAGTPARPRPGSIGGVGGDRPNIILAMTETSPTPAAP
jgi:hypothetical protein